MKVIYLAGAMLFICVAHFIRVSRWELFIKIYEKPQRRNLIQAMSWGYLLNYILPYKMGDLVRAWLAGKKMKNGKTLGFSTVVVDRYLDILSVGIIFICLSVSGVDGVIIKETALFYVFLTTILTVLTGAVYLFRGTLKKVLRFFAGMFNKKIEASLLQFAWALIWNFKNIFLKINKIKLLIITAGMWLFYIISYYLLGEFLSLIGTGISWTDLFTILFAQNSIKSSSGTLPFLENNQMLAYPGLMIVYMLVPLVVILMLSLGCKKEEVGDCDSGEYLKLLPHLDPKERLEFLENYFSNENREYVANYLKINQDISIIRDYSAGSKATTMLCMDGNSTFFRKYAFGEDGEKLYQQILWIESNQKNIALPAILKKEKTDVYCYYDMPYSSNSVGLFEYIHSMPIEQSWSIVQRLIENLEESIYKVNTSKANKATVHEYVELKIKKNLDIIKNARVLRSLQHYEYVIINGVEYKNLFYYEKFLNEDYLQEVFKNDSYAVIHGDLTIENIICQRDKQGNDDFYIIDPNTGNVHDSPNLDYGKLLQSIHGGYEFLTAIKDVSVSENRINFMYTRSSAYMELHKMLRDYMQNNLGYERTRSIYFHEIVHWIRLMSYKIEKEGKRALLFYAGMLMVMNDVAEMYEENR